MQATVPGAGRAGLSDARSSGVGDRRHGHDTTRGGRILRAFESRAPDTETRGRRPVRPYAQPPGQPRVDHRALHADVAWPVSERPNDLTFIIMTNTSTAIPDTDTIRTTIR